MMGTNESREAMNIVFGGNVATPPAPDFVWPDDIHPGAGEGTYGPHEVAAIQAGQEMGLTTSMTVDVATMTGRGLGVAVAARFMAGQ
jgi:hypothetical protein